MQKKNYTCVSLALQVNGRKEAALPLHSVGVVLSASRTPRYAAGKKQKTKQHHCCRWNSISPNTPDSKEFIYIPRAP